MKLRCLGVIDTYKDVFTKEASYEASELTNGFCDVYGNRLKRDGTPWLGLVSLGYIVVSGVGKFEIITEESDD